MQRTVSQFSDLFFKRALVYMVVFHAMLMRWKLLRQHQSPPTVLEEKKNRLDQKILIVECDEAAVNVCCSLFYFLRI